MDISGSHRISASRAAVWAALNDPAVLQSCIPGCESLTRNGDGSYEGVVASKVGPIRTRIEGEATVSEHEAPNRFSISARGADTASGGGEGSAEVTLEEDGGETILAYSGAAEAHGKISQLGQRLLTGVFRKTVETTCENLSVRLGAGDLAGAPESLPEAPPLAPEAPVDGPPPVLDAPPLAAGPVPPPAPNSAIAPTGTPDVDPAAIAAADVVDGEATGAGVTTRIMLVAAIVVAVGALVYYMIWQAPPV